MMCSRFHCPTGTKPVRTPLWEDQETVEGMSSFTKRPAANLRVRNQIHAAANQRSLTLETMMEMADLREHPATGMAKAEETAKEKGREMGKAREVTPMSDPNVLAAHCK